MYRIFTVACLMVFKNYKFMINSFGLPSQNARTPCWPYIHAWVRTYIHILLLHMYMYLCSDAQLGALLRAEGPGPRLQTVSSFFIRNIGLQQCLHMLGCSRGASSSTHKRTADSTQRFLIQPEGPSSQHLRFVAPTAIKKKGSLGTRNRKYGVLGPPGKQRAGSDFEAG